MGPNVQQVNSTKVNAEHNDPSSTTSNFSLDPPDLIFRINCHVSHLTVAPGFKQQITRLRIASVQGLYDLRFPQRRR